MDWSKLVNLTPHSIVIYTKDDKITISASGMVFRLIEEEILLETKDGVDIVQKKYSLPVDWGKYLSNENEGAVYVVSLVILSHLAKTKESLKYIFLAPDTGRRAVRDEEGKIIGVRGFVTL